MFKHLKSAAVAAVLSISLTGAAKSSTVVDVELFLLTDTSGSVDATDFNLMMEGYARAFESTSVKNAISNTGAGIAVALGFFDSVSRGVNTAWTHLTNSTTADAFATAIRATARIGSGGTNIIAGIQGAVSAINNNDFDGVRKVIDLSGDGSQTVSCNFSDPICTPLQDARDAALVAGVTNINALFINDRNFFGDTGTETIDSVAYGENNVIAGPGSFVLSVANFNDFQGAIEDKIVREVTGTNPIPLPAGAWLLLTGIGAFAALRRRRSKTAAA